jgi:hypothetical protein
MINQIRVSDLKPGMRVWYDGQNVEVVKSTLDQADFNVYKFVYKLGGEEVFNYLTGEIDLEIDTPVNPPGINLIERVETLETENKELKKELNDLILFLKCNHNIPWEYPNL